MKVNNVDYVGWVNVHNVIKKEKRIVEYLIFQYSACLSALHDSLLFWTVIQSSILVNLSRKKNIEKLCMEELVRNCCFPYNECICQTGLKCLKSCAYYFCAILDMSSEAVR